MTRRGYALVGAATFAVLGAYFVHPLARFYLHFLMTQLCQGVSAGKIIFTLVFLAAFAAALAAVREAKQPARWRGAVLVLAWVAGLGAALATHIGYCRTFGMALDWPSFHWYGGLNSVNSTAHIHTSKVAIAYGLDALGLTSWHERFDTGAAYCGAVPRGLAVASGACFVVSLGLTFWHLPALARRYPPRQAGAVAAVMALAGAALCRSILDGGPLAYDVPAAALVLFVLTRNTRLEEAGAWTVRHALKLLAGTLVWIACVAAVDLGVVEHLLGQCAYRASEYGLVLALGAMCGTTVLARRRAVCVALPCACVVMVFLVDSIRTDLLPFWCASPSRIIQYEMCSGLAEVDGPDSRDSVQARQVAIEDGRSVLSAYLSLGENPRRVRRVAVRRDPPGQPTGLFADLIILRRKDRALALAPTEILSLERFEPASGSAFPRFHVQVRFDADVGPVLWRGPGARPDQLDENERFMAYTLLDHYLRNAGVQEYILIPYAQYVGEIGGGPSRNGG